jgi:HEAT repeat protein
MPLAGTTKLLTLNLFWRGTGMRAAGRALVNALGSENEDLRTIAGMLLVKSGRAAEPLLEEAMSQRRHLPMVVTVLGNIGSRKVEPELRTLARDSDPDVADAAQEALRALEAKGV